MTLFYKITWWGYIYIYAKDLPTEPRGAAEAAAPSIFGLFGKGGAEVARSALGTAVAPVILLAMDLPRTALDLDPTGTDAEVGRGVLDLAGGLVARAGRSSATSASSSSAPGEASWAC